MGPPAKRLYAKSVSQVRILSFPQTKASLVLAFAFLSAMSHFRLPYALAEHLLNPTKEVPSPCV